MGNHGGRGGDYIEQQDYEDRYVDDGSVTDTVYTIPQLQQMLDEFKAKYPKKEVSK